MLIISSGGEALEIATWDHLKKTVGFVNSDKMSI